ncbi:hypothetical protein DFH27DRAFT_604424 [Peziza echinospora]|nr:hypothetical protein DFH27DRAFT_604424 [Peziza echinospora]
MATQTHVDATHALTAPRTQPSASRAPHHSLTRSNAALAQYPPPTPRQNTVIRSDSKQGSKRNRYHHNNRRRNNTQNHTDLACEWDEHLPLWIEVATYNAQKTGARLVLTRPEILALQAWMDSRFMPRGELQAVLDTKADKVELQALEQRYQELFEQRSRQIDGLNERVHVCEREIEEIKGMVRQRPQVMGLVTPAFVQSIEGKNAGDVVLPSEELGEKETEYVSEE